MPETEAKTKTDPQVFINLLDTAWFDAMDDFFDDVERTRGDLSDDQVRDALGRAYGDSVLDAWDDRVLDGLPSIPARADASPAYCGHERTGLISTQDPDAEYDESQPYSSASVCDRTECRERVTRHVAGNSNRQSVYYNDAERRAKRGD